MKTPILHIPRTQDQKALLHRLMGIGRFYCSGKTFDAAWTQWMCSISGMSELSVSPYVYIDSAKNIAATSFSQSTLDKIGKPGSMWDNWMYVNSADQLVRLIAARKS